MLQEDSFFHLFELTPDLVCIACKEGYFQKINPAVSHTLGYTNAELMARPIASFIHPDDLQRTADNRLRLLAGKPLLNFKNRYLTKNGNTVWLEWTSVYLPDKALVFAIAKNITGGQLAAMALEEKVQSLSQLHTHVKQYTDKERQQIASTLHEDLGQLASVIKTKMEWLTGQPAAHSSPNSHLLQQTIGATGELLNKLRHLSYTLSDGSLTLQGLNESLLGLCRKFSAETGLPCQYKNRFSERRLTDEQKLDIYRICQEAIQNIGKHAAARKVTVFLRQTRRGLLLTIADDGKGFEPGKEKLSGLSAMEARALSLQGTLTIDTGIGGTTVTLLLKTHPVAAAVA